MKFSLRTLFFSVFLVPLFLATCSQVSRASATTYYVSPSGSDDDPGNLAQPWKTIQYAADSLAPGDTLFVRAGVYNEAVFINVSGSAAGGYITIQNYEGESAILDGTGLTNPDGDIGFYIENQNYLIIDGFEIRNYKTTITDAVPTGVFVTGAAHHIRLENLSIHNIETNAEPDGNAHGLAVYGTESPAAIHDILISNNELYDLKLGNSEALVLNGNVSVFTVTQNIVHDNNNIGIDVIGFETTAPDPDYDQARDGVISENIVYNIDSASNPAYFGEQSAAGIYVDGGTRILIERNQVFQSNIGIELASEHQGRSTSYVTVRNNFIYRNHIAGLAMGGYDTGRGSTENCLILNNTFFENDTNQDGNGELWLQYDIQNNQIQNNIFYSTAQNLLMANPYTQNQNNIVDYNLYFTPAGALQSEWQWQNVFYEGFGAYQAGSGNDAHSLFANPQLVDLSVLDLHLKISSPAINAGLNLPGAGSTDIDGEARITGGVIDMGADEFIALLSVFLPLAVNQ